MSTLRNKRLTKELATLARHPHVGITVRQGGERGDSLETLLVHLTVADNPLYDGQAFLLRMQVPPTYPIEAPDCTFLGPRVPLHPHVYSNGHICLDILYGAWSPVHGVGSLALSLQSMLAGNTVAQRPPDDADYLRHAPASAKRTHFTFHDDAV